jgi:MFS family permease
MKQPIKSNYIINKDYLFLFGVGLGYFVALLDLTMINVALPDMSTDIGLSSTQFSLVANIYTWAMIIGLPIGGRLGDRLGKRRIFISSMVAIGIFGGIGGIALQFNVILLSRFAIGLFAGLMIPQTLTLIKSVFPQEKQGWALGVWGAIGGIASIVGPALGGVLVSFMGWRVIFYINTPIALFAVIAAYYWIPKDVICRNFAIDIKGIILLCVTCTSFGTGLMLAISLIYNWGAIFIIMGFVACFLLIYVERSQNPVIAVIPTDLWKNVPFLNLCTLGALASACTFMITFAISIFAQRIMGSNPFIAGMLVVPASIVSVITSPKAGKLLDADKGFHCIFWGLIACLISFILLLLAFLNLSTITVIIASAIFGLGNGLLMPSLTSLALNNIKLSSVSAASSLVVITRQLGILIGGITSVGSLLLGHVTIQNIHSHQLVNVIWFALIFIALGFILFGMLRTKKVKEVLEHIE